MLNVLFRIYSLHNVPYSTDAMNPALPALSVLLVLLPVTQVSADTSSQASPYDWGPWTAWSVCSEPCGYGTAYRIRQCHAQLRYNRACSGQSKQWQVCNQKNCTDGTLDYRTRECAKNNNVYYGRRTYSWIPYINDQAPCELSCKSQGSGYYARFKRSVADGVICNEENTAVCMQGTCVESGCDGVLGSGTGVDRCGECGGDGTSCRQISGIFTRTHLTHRGYNVVTTIPQGACSINITEMRRSKNHLALSTPAGYFLNGNMRLGPEGKVKAAGTTFIYSRSTGPYCPGECLTAPGPLNTSLRVELIYFGRNPGISYHFTIPRNSSHGVVNTGTQRPDTDVDDHNRHNHRHHQRRHRGRPDATSGQEGASHQINHGNSPIHVSQPNTNSRQPLQGAQRPPVIVRSSYQRAGSSGGTHGGANAVRDNDTQPPDNRSRPRSFINVNSKQTDKKALGESSHHGRTRDRSDLAYRDGQYYVKGQNGSIHYKHYYHTNQQDGLGGVPVSSGEDSTSQSSSQRGQKGDDRYAEFRSTTQYQPRASIPNVIPSTLTQGPAPPRTRGTAYSGRTYDGYDNRVHGYNNERHLYSWRISGFTSCTEPCGGGLQQTRVICVKNDNRVEVIEENCDPNLKPESTTIVCNNQPCEAAWDLSEWTPCSVTCGNGLQKRTVTCKQRISPTLTIGVSSANCPHPRPQSRQYCKREPCQVWRAGNWSKCSSDCGFGQRTREVQCVDTSGAQVSSRLCGSQVKPSVEEICDMGSCAQGWFHTKWSKECSAECGRGHYFRQVYCSASDGSRLAEAKCGGKANKPKERKKCKSAKPCGGKWFTGPWSKCNSTCGFDAYKERDVLCIKRHGKRLNHVVKAHNCEKSSKPPSREWCGRLADCEPQWFITAWSECSKACGTGVRTREAKCLDTQLTASPDCDKAHKPNRRQSCNKQACEDPYQAFSEMPVASQNESLQMDGSSASSQTDSVECENKQNSGWCYMASQARLCGIPYYKDMCCQTCSKVLVKPH